MPAVTVLPARYAIVWSFRTVPEVITEIIVLGAFQVSTWIMIQETGRQIAAGQWKP